MNDIVRFVERQRIYIVVDIQSSLFFYIIFNMCLKLLKTFVAQLIPNDIDHYILNFMPNLYMGWVVAFQLHYFNRL